MRKTIFLLSIVWWATMSVSSPVRVRAQSRADTAAVLLDAARRLDADGQRGAARALLQMLQRQYGETSAGISASTLLGSAVMRARPEPSGRVELTVWSTAYGLWLGAATPAMLDSEEPAAYGAGLLAGAPLGFLSARAYLKKRPNLTVGQARAITFAGTWGTWQGAGWMQVLGGGREEYCTEFGCDTFETDPSTESMLAAMVGGGLAGIATGAAIANKPINAGVAATVSASGLWGTWFGLALGIMGDAEEDNLLAVTLLGGDAAVATAGILAPRWNPSVNRVRLVSLSGLVGGVAGAGLVLIVQPNDDKTAIGIPLAASIAGLVLGSNATRNYDRDHAPEPESRNSLLHFDGDRVRVGVPAPVPVMRRDMLRPDMRRGGLFPTTPRPQPALAVNVFTARF